MKAICPINLLLIVIKRNTSKKKNSSEINYKYFIYLTSGTGPASPAGGIRFLIFLLLVPAEIPVVIYLMYTRETKIYAGLSFVFSLKLYYFSCK